MEPIFHQSIMNSNASNSMKRSEVDVTETSTLSQARSLIHDLQKRQRQLGFTNIPVRLNAEFLHQAAIAVATATKLAADDTDVAGDIMPEVQTTWTLIHAGLKRLNIWNCVYAPSDKMAWDAICVQHEMLERVKTFLIRAKIAAPDQAKFLAGLKLLIEGRKADNVGDNWQDMAIGLLHGLSNGEILERCAIRRRTSLSQLLKAIQYKSLKYQIGPQTQMKNLQTPESFKQQNYQEYPSHVSSAPTCRPDEDHEENNFARFVQTFESQLRTSKIPDYQRIRLVSMMQARLESKQYSATESIFVDGLIAGYDQQTMHRQCMAAEENRMLTSLLDAIDAEELQRGRASTHISQDSTHKTNAGAKKRKRKHPQDSNVQPQIVEGIAAPQNDGSNDNSLSKSRKKRKNNTATSLPTERESREAMERLDAWARNLVVRQPY